ncbi:MAG: BamA/TamA family outer membrane protein [Bacillota bacterium]
MKWKIFIAIVYLFSSHVMAMEADSLSKAAVSDREPSLSEAAYSNFSPNNDPVNDYSFRVDSIKVSGNEVTDEDIILRELTFKSGDVISQKDLDYNSERIFSLSLFTNLKLAAPTKDSPAKSSNVLIAVSESWYIWPIPFIDIKDNAINKATYGLDILYKNFRGRNETLEAAFGFGYDPRISLVYNCPWLVKSQDIFLTAAIQYSNVENKSVFAERLYGSRFEQKMFSGSLTIGKRFNLFTSASLLAGYDYIETPRYVPGVSASSGNIDRIFKTGVSSTYDSRNLKQFPDFGVFLNLSYVHLGFNINGINYSVLSGDFRHYMKIIGDLSAKWRAASRITLGRNIPFYDFSRLGYGEKVRGHFNELKEGNNTYVGSFELKYPIIKEWDFSVKLPVVPKELTSYRIGIYPYIFADAGAAQLKGHQLSMNDFYSGYGAGVIFLFLPYNIFRIELALNEYKKKEFIFGFGFSF